MTIEFAKRVMVALIVAAGAMVLFGPAPANAAGGSVLVGVATTDTGQPISANSLIQFADSKGNLETLTVLKPGVYRKDTSNLTPPIIIKAGDIFSYSETGKGVANVTPFSDLIVNQVYETLKTNAATQFMSLTPIQLTPVQLQVTSALVRNAFQQPFTAFKVSPTFDFFTTKFSFKQGFGQLLSNTTYSGFGTPSQMFHSTLPNTVYVSADFKADTKNNWSTAVWTSGPVSGPYSGSYDYTLVPTASGAGAAYNGVNSFLQTQWLPTLKHEGKLLDYTNILGFYDTNFLNDGKDATTQSYFDVTYLRDIQLSNIRPGVMRSFQPNLPDSSHDTIGLDLIDTENKSGVALTKHRTEFFNCPHSGTGCLRYGNQQLGGTRTGVKFESDSFSSGVPTSFYELKGKFLAPKDAFSSIFLSDLVGYFSSTPTKKATKTITLKPTHNGLPFLYDQDEFKASATLSSPYDYTDVFTYDGTLSGGGTVPIGDYVLGATYEPINWLSPSPNGSHQLSDFNLTVPIVVKYLPPLTYPLTQVKLEGTACSASQSLQLRSVEKVISPNAKSASINVPKTVMGQPTAGFELRLRFDGPFGQNANFVYGVGQTCTF